MRPQQLSLFFFFFFSPSLSLFLSLLRRHRFFFASSGASQRTIMAIRLGFLISVSLFQAWTSMFTLRTLFLNRILYAFSFFLILCSFSVVFFVPSFFFRESLCFFRKVLLLFWIQRTERKNKVTSRMTNLHFVSLLFFSFLFLFINFTFCLISRFCASII